MKQNVLFVARLFWLSKLISNFENYAKEKKIIQYQIMILETIQIQNIINLDQFFWLLLILKRPKLVISSDTKFPQSRAYLS